MMAVAVGWQVFEIRHKPLDLGLIGLLEFIPLMLLALPGGYLSDRFSRRLMYGISLVMYGGVAALLLLVTISGPTEVWPFFVLAAMIGVAGAIGIPSSRSMPPTLVPTELVASAIAFRSVGFQVAVVGGPALGGLLFALQPELVYIVAVVLFAAALVSVVSMTRPGRLPSLTGEEPTFNVRSVLDGLRFLRHTRMVLGAITLDLFAVLFGGAVALLPVFASEILDVGPAGLGVLRSAPAVGALAGAILIARRPLGRHAGRTLLISVAVFGASIVVFGLSRSFALSLIALAVSGFADLFSVNIRATTIALATPDELRGRVIAVEMIFISASNELGAFESGAAAALFGTVKAVVGGGLLTIAIAVGWPRFFPELAHIDRMEDIRPEPVRA
jgi:predicted MFS family arabinose efflux permease